MRTGRPSAAAMFTSASKEKREIRPRSRSFIRGCVTPHVAPASACVHPFVSMTSVICRMSAARARKFAACSGVSANASHTLLKLWIVLVMFPSLEFSVPCPGLLKVACTRRPAFLLKRMEHVHRVCEPSNVEHAIGAGVIPYP
mgnify:CR=1 FL=1